MVSIEYSPNELTGMVGEDMTSELSRRLGEHRPTNGPAIIPMDRLLRDREMMGGRESDLKQPSYPVGRTAVRLERWGALQAELFPRETKLRPIDLATDLARKRTVHAQGTQQVGFIGNGSKA